MCEAVSALNHPDLSGLPIPLDTVLGYSVRRILSACEDALRKQDKRLVASVS